jgi:Ca2+-binding EF-hand superfamily protein
MTSPDDIKQHCRLAHRAEQDLPKVKWAAFQEQRRREDLAAIRFQKKQGELKKKIEQPNPIVVKFLGQLRKCLTKRMKESGGTEHSVIRKCFLNWDADCSGELTDEEFLNAMHSLGLSVDQSVAREVVKYYDVDGDGEMKYVPLIEDVARGQRHFLHHPGPSARFEDEPLAKKPLTPFIKLFLKKLKMKLHAMMKKNGDTPRVSAPAPLSLTRSRSLSGAGEYERILIRRAFLNWDADASGELACREFMGAMRQVGISLTEDEAAKVVHFYDVDGDGEMRYQPLVDDVTSGAPHFIHHPDTLAEAKKQPQDDPDDILLSKMFTVRPMERQKNAVVEAFKINLRRRLEDHIRAVGGTIHSILREAFLCVLSRVSRASLSRVVLTHVSSVTAFGTSTRRASSTRRSSAERCRGSACTSVRTRLRRWSNITIARARTAGMVTTKLRTRIWSTMSPW